MPTTMRYERVGLTLLLVHDERNPSDADWSQWVRHFAAAARDANVRGLLVISRGGGPNSRQRTEVVQGILTCLGHEAMQLRTAVCSDSRLARGITTAISWLFPNPHLRSFGYDQRAAALDFLRVDLGLRPALLSAADRLERELRQAADERAQRDGYLLMHSATPPAVNLLKRPRPSAQRAPRSS